MAEEEFWGLTLRQFDALVRCNMMQQERLDYRAALVCSVIANVNRDPKKRPRPFTPRDFMTTAKMQKSRTERQTWEQQLKTVEVLNLAFAGDDRRMK